MDLVTIDLNLQITFNLFVKKFRFLLIESLTNNHSI